MLTHWTFGSKAPILCYMYRIRKEHAMTPVIPSEQPEPHEEEPRRPMWELAECTCPDWCERDHERD
jgi:hypothetical protein